MFNGHFEVMYTWQKHSCIPSLLTTDVSCQNANAKYGFCFKIGVIKQILNSSGVNGTVSQFSLGQEYETSHRIEKLLKISLFFWLDTAIKTIKISHKDVFLHFCIF